MAWFKEILPWIGAAASATPAGPFVALGAKILSAKLGKTGKDEIAPDAKSIGDAITEALTKPEDLLKLKEADQEFQVRMTEMGISSATKFEEMANADRANARSREIAVRDKIPAVLAVAITIGFFTLLYWIVGHGVIENSKDVVNIMLGTLGTAWIAVVTYYFGSSAGSAKKDDIIRASQSS